MKSKSVPVAGRLKRPGWTDPRLLIGLVLIVLSVWGTTFIIAKADRTEPHLVAKYTLTPGTILTEGNTQVSNVRVGEGYLSAAEPSWGSVVTRTIAPGELVPASAVVDSEDYGLRPVAVESSLSLAKGIAPGSVVDVWLTRDGVLGTESILVASGLVVYDVDRSSGSFTRGAETVYLLVPANGVGSFLSALAEDGDIVVVGIPQRDGA